MSSASEGSGPELSIVLLTFNRWDRRMTVYFSKGVSGQRRLPDPTELARPADDMVVRPRSVAVSPKVQRYSGVVEDFLYRIEQRALPVAHIVEVVLR